MSLENLIAAASGRIPADLQLKNARIVNVFSGKIEEGNLAIYGGRICGLGDYESHREIDLEGRLLLPGYIDGHIHVESSMITVPEFARKVVPLGTTAVVIDPHEIANVLGLDGIKYMLDSSKNQTLDVFLMLPSCVPTSDLETAGANISAGDIFPFLSERWVLGLGEMMNYPGVLSCDKGVLDKIKLVRGKKIDGHAPGLSGLDLNAYIAAGIKSDHEATTLEEAREKLSAGMHVMIREGTATKNLLDLIPLVNSDNWPFFSFVSDDRAPGELLDEGHINYMVRLAIENGMEPVTAVRLATINTARYFGLEKHGAVAPGYNANLQVLDSFSAEKPSMVFKKGELVAEDGQMIEKPRPKRDIYIRGSVNVKWLKKDDFKVPVEGDRVRVIEIIPDQIITGSGFYKTPEVGGFLQSDTSRDLLKICVIERHRATGRIGKGILKGMGLKSGAIATSVAHDSHNIVVTGVSDEDIFKASLAVIKMGGGIAVADKGEILGTLPLPIAGLMSEMSVEKVDEVLARLLKVTKGLGALPRHPFFTLSFLCLPVIPELKITDKGLVDTEKFEVVDLFYD